MTEKQKQSEFLDLLSIQRDWMFTEYLPSLESMEKSERRKESTFILQAVKESLSLFEEGGPLTPDKDRLYSSRNPVLFLECLGKYVWQSSLLKVCKANPDIARKVTIPLVLSIITESPHSNHVSFDDYEDLADLMGLSTEEFQDGIALAMTLGFIHIVNQNYSFTLPQSLAESSWQVSP